jgi:hypothetical protein
VKLETPQPLGLFDGIPDCPLHGAHCMAFLLEYVNTFSHLIRGEAYLDKTWIGGTFVATRVLPAPIAQNNIVRWFQTTIRGGMLDGKAYQYTTYTQALSGHNEAVMEVISAKTAAEIIADNNAVLPGVLPFPDREEIRRRLADLQDITKARLLELLNQIEAAEGPLPFESLNPADAEPEPDPTYRPFAQIFLDKMERHWKTVNTDDSDEFMKERPDVLALIDMCRRAIAGGSA